MTTTARLVVAFVLTLSVVTGTAGIAAAAAPIRECGNYGYRDSTGKVGWGRSPISGAGTFNVTTRRVRCKRARRFVRRYRGTDTYFPKWRCREANEYEFSDIRCAASRGRVIHWQAGS